MIDSEQSLQRELELAVSDGDLEAFYQLLRLHGDDHLCKDNFNKIIALLLHVFPKKQTERGKSIAMGWLLKIVTVLFSHEAFGKNAVTKSLFRLGLSSGSSLAALFVDTVAKLNLSQAVLRKATAGIRLFLEDSYFIDLWFTRTEYPLSFGISFYGNDHAALSLLDRVLDSGRLPRYDDCGGNANSFPRDYRNEYHPLLFDVPLEAIDAAWPGARVAKLLALCRSEAFHPDAETRANNVQKANLLKRVWCRAHHALYYDYALALAPLGLPVYVCVWIIEWLVPNRDVPERQAIRIVQSLFNKRVASGEMRNARIARSKTNSNK